ncbi:hypothetical protein HG531_002300 [Fusarium graminearum]|nr:hypothetical protein HG531_002300 [Fusarium graminearum]
MEGGKRIANLGLGGGIVKGRSRDSNRGFDDGKNKSNKIEKPKSFSLEGLLEPGEVDDKQLASNAESNGPVKQVVRKDPNFAPEDRLGLRSATQSVKHVEEDEACKCHGGISSSHLTIGHHFTTVDEHCPDSNDGSRCEHTLNKLSRGLEAEAGADKNKSQTGSASAELEGEEVLDVVEDAFALLNCSKNCGKVIIRQDHICCFFGNISSVTAHRDTNIGFLECRRIVDTISSHGDDIAS